MYKIICFTLRVNKGHISPYCKNIIEFCIRIHGSDMRDYVAPSQRSAVSSIVHVHILGAETCFERGVGWGKVKTKCMHLYQTSSDPRRNIHR